MGYERHRAIIVSSYNKDYLMRALVSARDLGLGDLCTNMVQSRVNGHWTFCIVPDGSKVGWEESDQAEGQRDEFWDRLEELYREDVFCSFVEVQYRDDNGETKIVRSSDEIEEQIRKEEDGET